MSPSQYDEFAGEYDAHAENSPYNALYDRPALLSLLGDVAGRRVLDAGCGSGHYTRELLARGATVTGVDSSASLIELARQRYDADFHVHDLAQPLTFLSDSSIDVVLMGLAFHYLEDPVPTLREFHRVLRPSGYVVLSTHHPTLMWQQFEGSYFADEMVSDTWSQGWTLRFRRAPLEALVTDFITAGFVVSSLTESRPVKEMAQMHPATHEKLTTQPGFINFRLDLAWGHGT